MHSAARILMFALVVLTLALGATATSAAAQVSSTLEGEVTDTFIGTIGDHDLCITFLEGDGQFGIVEPLEDCAIASRFESRLGTRVAIPHDKTWRITWSEQLRALHAFRAVTYIRASQVTDLEPRGPGLYARVVRIESVGDGRCRLAVKTEWRSTGFPELEYALETDHCASDVPAHTKIFVPQHALRWTGPASFEALEPVQHREPLGAGFYGYVDEVFMGEVDPALSSYRDYCVTFLRIVEKPDGLVGDIFGFVEPIQECPAGRQLAERLEARVFIPEGGVRALESGELSTALQSYREAGYAWLSVAPQELGGVLVLGAAELELPPELAPAGKTTAQIGLMKVTSQAIPFSPTELQAALAEGHRLFGDACDGVPLEEASFHGPNDVGSFLHFLRPDSRTSTNDAMDDVQLRSMGEWLEREGVGKWRMFYGEAATHTCGRFRQAQYHLVWNTETNQVLYLVFSS